MRPQRPRSIFVAARLATRQAPLRLVSTTRLNCSSLIRMISVSSVMPALATSTSTGSELVLDRRERRVDRGGVGDVAGDPEQAGGRPGAPVGDGDPVALPGEGLRDGEADAPVAAGDQNRPGHAPSLPCRLSCCKALPILRRWMRTQIR